MRINLVITGANKAKKEELQQLLKANPQPDSEHDLHITTADEFHAPRGRHCLQIEEDGVQFNYFFNASVNDERKKLDQFVNSHTAFIQNQLITNQDFQSNDLLKGMFETVKKGFTEHVVPSAGVVAEGVTSHWNGTNTMFSAPKLKQLAKAEFILGATAGLLSIGIGFLSPLAAGILAVAAVLLVVAAIYHQTKANGLESELPAPM
ncbi:MULTISPECIES: hypothetical protein [Legionella]|uniref:Uncharacterized protein n=1 Tax=Legionella drozanskii LLAP-1 TaxID=1212489 RepID=A0A0W0TBU8_9GAMM|nr:MULTISPECIES: hypothetical protein [Legionella]KTC93042.1 hypothetical protein Ldro_0413 [Legionella drozanskii LLAP-1]PJE11947.1 MAG: hypothetical protein CK430_08235 [Legionella sp.]